MKAVVAAFNQEKALVGAFSVIMNLRMEIFEALYEALEGFTMALMMTSAVTYVAKISTPTTLASVMGLMGSLFFGIGKGSGSLFGGLVMAQLGSRWTFRLLAAIAGTCGLGYTGFQVKHRYQA